MDFQEAAVATATITIKGQIIPPEAVRTNPGLEAGHRVQFIEPASRS